MVGPLLAVILSGTHSSATLSREGLQLLPGDALGANLSQALSTSTGISGQVTLATMLETSLIVASGIAILTTAFSLLTAYALVYFRLRPARAILWLCLVTLLFPLEARFLQTFLVADALGLVNTRVGVILPVLPLALGTLFLVQGLRQLPDALWEAATLDGAGPLRFLRDFILPLMRPQMGAVFAVSFIIGWNQYLVRAGSGAGMVYITLTLLPPLLLLVALQRWVLASLRV